MNYFRYKQFNKDVITVAVGYYLRYALSYRDISEIVHTEDSFLLKLYYKFNFATEPNHKTLLIVKIFRFLIL